MNLKLPKDKKETAIARIQQYYKEERDEEIGHLAAEMLLDFFIQEVGPYIYNQALFDAQAWLEKKLDDIRADYYTLEQKTSR